MSVSVPTIDESGQAATRRHLLEAAEEVFAEVGFRAATVRQICQRAGANIAAINYHFGDKEELYRVVLKETYKSAVLKYPPNFGLQPKATPEQRLRAFVFSFLMRIFSEGPSARHGKLMAREMIEPTSALDAIVEEEMRPMSVVLTSIMGDLMGGKADQEKRRLCALSVVSQVLFYHHCRPVVTRMFPDMKFNEAGIERLTEHITQFSLAAIKAMTKTSKK
ncbi:MAG: transcriptional regulator, TetR family [Pedosphaera sp.]|nr:transcriptional regulator, TetR family [Pedosphaera sp.]